jgi:2-iminobutanoate/2-iminopropanoate deaminase
MEDILEKSIISTKNAPAAIGPYSQAVAWNNLLFISGQIPLNPTTGEMVTGDFESQIRQVLDNLKSILEAAGLTTSSVLKTTIFLTDLADFAKANEIYSQYFAENPPARSTIQVSALPKGAKVEIEAIAGKR